MVPGWLEMRKKLLSCITIISLAISACASLEAQSAAISSREPTMSAAFREAKPTGTPSGGNRENEATNITPAHQATEDPFPFVLIGVEPGYSSKAEVREALGIPDETSADSWSYGFSDYSGVVTIVFEDEIVSGIWIPISDYTLEDLVLDLGVPAVIEHRGFDFMATEPPAVPQKVFHYPELGLSYASRCSYATIEDCSTHYRTDEISILHQFIPTSEEEFILNHPNAVFVEWGGFAE